MRVEFHVLTEHCSHAFTIMFMLLMLERVGVLAVIPPDIPSENTLLHCSSVLNMF